MTLDFSTSNRWLASLYGTALVLFVLVLAAGAFMIAGTLNSSVAARTSFFGCCGALGPRRARCAAMSGAKRCSGALSRCRRGWPSAALSAGRSCALLRFLSPSYFYDMPMFALSPVALVFRRAGRRRHGRAGGPHPGQTGGAGLAADGSARQ